MFLSSYGKGDCWTITIIALIVAVACGILGWWIGVGIALVAGIALLLFFRDPDRSIPSQRGVIVSPADGTISSIHHLDHYEAFGEGALCIRVFLSVLNVHVNRSPCHGEVKSIAHKPGKHRNALNPESAEDNESVTTVLVHPQRRHPVAAVRQIAGLIARRIICGLHEGQIVQRGQRMGLIKFGSTTEVYLPDSLHPEARVKLGEKVEGGATVLAMTTPLPPVHVPAFSTARSADLPEGQDPAEPPAAQAGQESGDMPIDAQLDEDDEPSAAS